MQEKNHKKTKFFFTEIPEKRFFTISEVAALFDLKQHVLRYWEEVIPQLKPAKRRGNRRVYRHQDVLMVREICHLLYEQGYTIEGAVASLGKGKSFAMNRQKFKDFNQELINELENVVECLS